MTQIGFNTKNNLNFKTAQDMPMHENQQAPLEQQPLPNVPLPQIYNVPEATEKPALVEEIKKYDMMGLVYPWIEYPLTMVGTCATMAYGVEKFSKACGGEYEKSLVGKAANLGDKIEKSKFVQSKPFQTVWGWGEKTKGKVKHFFRNSDLLNAIFKTPSQPEWTMPKDEMLNMSQRVIHNFSQISKTLKWSEEGFTKLTELGLDKDDKKFLKEFFGDIKLSTIEEKASNTIRLKRLGLSNDTIRSIVDGANATEIVKAKELEHIGLKADFIKSLEKKPASLKEVLIIEKACDKGRNIRIGAGHKSWLGPFQIFERQASLSEISNRLKSMMKGAKTKTGRAFATFLQKCHRGFTFGGHKMNVIFFVSPMLVESLMDVKKAEPNEKLGTAAHGLIHSVSWVFTFPLALKLMHHIGGMQYAGMDKKDVAKYRKLIEEFNEKANPFEKKSWKNFFGIGKKKAADQTFQSYSDYKNKLGELKIELNKLKGKNSKDQTLITKIGKQLGRFLTLDLETISSYKNGSAIGNFARKLPNFFKNVLGVPMRFILWGAITMGVFDVVINKGIKGCFGNFYDRFKEEEFVNGKKEQKKFLKQDLKARLYEANQKKVLGLESPAITGDFSNENLAKLAPSINAQTPKKSTQIEQQTPLGENLLKAPEEVTPEHKIPQQVSQEQAKISSDKNLQTEVKDQEETILNKALNSDVSDIKNKSPETLKPYVDQTLNTENAIVQQQDKLVKDNYTYIPASTPLNYAKEEKQKRDNYTYIPSSENILKKNQNPENVKKYIPSQMGAKFNKTFDNSGLEAALRRADRAEQRAIQTLAGNFNY